MPCSSFKASCVCRPAIMEEIVVKDGKIRNPSFTDYLIPTILDTPPMPIDVLELPDPHAPYGLRGAGEAPAPWLGVVDRGGVSGGFGRFDQSRGGGSGVGGVCQGLDVHDGRPRSCGSCRRPGSSRAPRAVIGSGGCGRTTRWPARPPAGARRRHTGRTEGRATPRVKRRTSGRSRGVQAVEERVRCTPTGSVVRAPVLFPKRTPGSGPALPGRHGLSATSTSVVRNSAAMDAAFCSAERVTLAGSTMPSSIMSTYSPVAALRP